MPPSEGRSTARFHAQWVVPVTSPPIRHGWVEIRGTRVVGWGPPENGRRQATGAQDFDLSTSIILPSLVNAHTHLELSGLRDAAPPADNMPAWTRALLSSVPQSAVDEGAIRAALREARASGTGLVGDIANTSVSVWPLVESGVDAVVFRELLGFNEQHPEERVARECESLSELRAQIGGHAHGSRVELNLAAHAPYSVSPGLFRAIRDGVPGAPLCLHLAESCEEIEFLRRGTGPWREVLEERGRWDEEWRPFDEGPVAYIERFGWLTPRTIAVHGVHLTDDELRRLAGAGVTLVTCPRSNRWTGAGVPPIQRFYASGVRVAVGTDSLASVSDLNVFAELAELRRLAPDVPASALMRSATRVGAEALGRHSRGSIGIDMEASLIAVTCDGSVDDVEEYLVSGIVAEDVRWLEEWVSGVGR